jgi:acyl-coenzyme A synthetase/AMP-(fatty) acid ligase
LSSDDAVLAVTTLSFDASVDELLGTLSTGGGIILANEEAIRDGDGLRALLEGSGGNFVNCTPATWRMLLDAGWQGSKELRGWTGGEALPSELAKELGERCGEAWNTYGPTETTVAATAWRIPDEEEEIRIGSPLPNYQVYVLDRGMRPQPLGVPGELYIGGVGVARGYRNRPELTGEQFVADPFGRHPGGRLYRTGDRVRFRDDGTLEFLGRLDNQVKIRGLRIELGEIEARLVEHEAVRQAAVAVHGEEIDRRLVAYIVFESDESLTPTEVRRSLRGTLPDYMVPSLVVELDQLPLTPSGKLDRRALLDPLLGEGGGEREYHPPRTAEEILMAKVWRDLLGIERVSRTDNFYEIGGHSLLSIRAVSAIEKLTGKSLEPRTMFFQTLEQLAKGLSEDPAEK